MAGDDGGDVDFVEVERVREGFGVGSRSSKSFRGVFPLVDRFSFPSLGSVEGVEKLEGEEEEGKELNDKMEEVVSGVEE